MCHYMCQESFCSLWTWGREETEMQPVNSKKKEPMERMTHGVASIPRLAAGAWRIGMSL